MNPKKIHKFIGLLLLAPLLGWIVTGAVFILKPGYAGAYEQISPKFYALENHVVIQPAQAWSEIRILRTVLGQHLLVKIDGQWQHLDPTNLRSPRTPSMEQERRLLIDAISANKERYGEIETRTETGYVTSTGVELTLDWNSLKISQSGYDTKLINRLYKIHYLQWLGNKQGNVVFGVLGLSLLGLLVFYGMALYIRQRKKRAIQPR